MNEAVVTFDGVWKSYPSYFHVTGGIKQFLFHLPQAVRELRARRSALEDVNFEIMKGENFGLIGHNGAGKSTTLGLIAGVLSPDRGRVTVRGRVSPLLALGAGFHPELTGRDNIMLNGVLLGLTRQDVLEHMDDILDFAELGDYIDMPVRIYSSGMYAKLGFSVVAHLKPEILLLDEVLAVGDIRFQQKCGQVFERFRSNPDVTLVLVSHGLESILEVCDRAAWIENKTVRMIGPAGEVVEAYQAANRPMIQVPADALPEFLPHLRAGVDALDCSEQAARFCPEVLAAPAGSLLRVKLFAQNTEAAALSWLTPPAPLILQKEGEGFALHNAQSDAPCLPFDVPAQAAGLDFARPFLLLLQAEAGGQPQGPGVWLPLFGSAEARASFENVKKAYMAARAGRGLPPHLWPGGKTVRIVARNIVTRDAVGNFAMEMAASLESLGIPVRTYACVSCPELAGFVTPIGELWREIEAEDAIFYHYSTHDEFLPRITELKCARKILYYHNVTPGHWFAESMPDVAAALERTREQYPLFAAFDAAAANSLFSLQDLLPHLAKDTPATVHAPTMLPERLTRLEPQAVPLPETGPFILWVGRIAPHKRPELALELFERLGELRDDVSLVMLISGRKGCAHLAESFERDLERLPAAVRARVHIKDNLNGAQLAFLYRRAALLLCTSGHEGYCLPVAEALAFGLPVAAFSQEAVEQTMAGRGLVLPEEVPEAAKMVDKLLASV